MHDGPGGGTAKWRWTVRVQARPLGLGAGPVLFAAASLVEPPTGMEAEAWRVAAAATWMAVWWLTEAVPVAVTALLPLVLFPVLGLQGIRESAAPYANPVLFLFLGGFALALALESCGLHRRIALAIVRRVGDGRARIVGGFMVAAAFLSMWISNTATAAMMLPVAVTLANRETGPAADRFAIVLLLGIAYGASIGGLGTLIGTPPNALLAAYMLESRGIEIGFGRWMLVGVPTVLVFLPLCWLVLTRGLRGPLAADGDGGGFQLAAPEPMSANEWRVAAVFGIVIALWIMRPLIGEHVSGVTDAGIAAAGAILMFVVPGKGDPNRRLLDGPALARLPWPILLLFGGGLSLGTAIDGSGLASWIGEAMAQLAAFPLVLTMGIVIAIVVFLTELTSNTATAATFIPVSAALAAGMGLDPLNLALPVALAASCAFMLPVATPPNAIVFGSGRLTVGQMARMGIALNLIAIALLLALGYLAFYVGLGKALGNG